MPAVLTLVLILTLAGCDSAPFFSRYQMEKDTQGRLVRIDKKTGETAVLEGNKWARLRSPEESRREEQERRQAEQPKSWEAIEVKALGDVTGQLSTRWSDGILYYRFVLSPYTRRLEQARKDWPARRGFTIDLKDHAGFVLSSINVPIDQMTSVIDENGKVTKLETNSSIALDLAVYKQAADWGFSWHLGRS